MNPHLRPLGRQGSWLLVLIPALLIGCQGTGGNGVGSLSVGPGTGSIPANSGLRFLATALDKNGQLLAAPKLTWWSSNTNVLLVDATGAATGVAPGSATVTVSADGKTAQARMTVTPQSTAPAGATWRATVGPPSRVTDPLYLTEEVKVGADGALYSLAVDINSLVLLASTDGGASFQARSSVVGVAGSSIFTSPDDPNTIWAAGVGSVDGGRAWTLRLPAGATPDGTLIFTPGQPGRLTYENFTSSDGGRTWTKLQYPDVTWSPKNPNVGVAQDWALSPPLDYVTLDGGASWTLAAPGGPSAGEMMAFGPDGTLWALPIDSGTLRPKLVRSVDNGLTWTMVTKNFNSGPLSVARSDGNRLFIGWGSVQYTSADGGLTWTSLLNGAQVASLDGKTLVALPATGSTCLQRSTDGGLTWTATTLCPADSPDFGAYPGGQVLVPVGLSSLAFSRDGGASFTTVPLRLGGREATYGYAFDASNPAKILALSTGSSASVSIDGGAAWASLGPISHVNDSQTMPPQALILPSGETLIFGFSLLRAPTLSGPFTSSLLPWLPQTMAVAFNPAAPATIYAATSSGFYRSTDDAASWSWASNGIDHVNLSALAVSPDGKTLLAGGASGQAYRSLDNGEHWTAASSGLKAGAISSLSFAADNATVFAGLPDGGVYRSLDGGLTWEPVVNGLRSYIVNSVAADPSDANVVYAATGYGVYKSTDKGGAWTPAGKGLSLPAAKSLGVSNDGRTLYVTQCNHYANDYYQTRSTIVRASTKGGIWPPFGEDTCSLFSGAPSAQTGSDLAPLARQPLGGALR